MKYHCHKWTIIVTWKIGVNCHKVTWILGSNYHKWGLLYAGEWYQKAITPIFFRKDRINTVFSRFWGASMLLWTCTQRFRRPTIRRKLLAQGREFTTERRGCFRSETGCFTPGQGSMSAALSAGQPWRPPWRIRTAHSHSDSRAAAPGTLVPHIMYSWSKPVHG